MENIDLKWRIGEYKFNEPLFKIEDKGIYNEASYYLLEAIITIIMSQPKKIIRNINRVRIQNKRYDLRDIVSCSIVTQQLIQEFKLYLKKINNLEEQNKSEQDKEHIHELIDKLIKIENKDDIKSYINAIYDFANSENNTNIKNEIDNIINNSNVNDKDKLNKMIEIIENQLNEKSKVQYKFYKNIKKYLKINEFFIDGEYYGKYTYNNFKIKLKDLSNSLKINEDIIKKMVKEIEKKVNIYLSLFNSNSSINNLKDKDLISIRDYINNCNNIIKRFRIKYKEGAGCFAILKSKTKNYFAFSGTYEINKNTHIINNFYTFANELNNALFEGKYILSKIVDNTICYTSVEKKTKKIKYLSKPIFYKKVKHLSLEVIGDAFGCCERKLLSSINNKIVNCDIYIRWVPCERCQPALIKFGRKINVYVLAMKFGYDDSILHKCKLIKRFVIAD